VAKEDEATQRGYAQTRQAVRASVRMHLNIAKTRVGGCRWTDGDSVNGQHPLAASKAVGKDVMAVTELGG